MLVTMAAWRAVAGLRLRILHPQWPRLAGSASHRLGGSFSGRHLQSGGSSGTSGGGRQLPLFALPSYRLARKSEEDLAAAAEGGEDGEEGSKSGGRFPFKVRRRARSGASTLTAAAGLVAASPAACIPSHAPHCTAVPQDEFEIARGVVISGQQVVETLTPLMTQERIQRIDQVCVCLRLPTSPHDGQPRLCRCVAARLHTWAVPCLGCAGVRQPHLQRAAHRRGRLRHGKPGGGLPQRRRCGAALRECGNAAGCGFQMLWLSSLPASSLPPSCTCPCPASAVPCPALPPPTHLPPPARPLLPLQPWGSGRCMWCAT